MTMDDLRRAVRAETGLARYVEQQWKKEIGSPASRAKLVAARRADYEKEYVHGWQIFFNTFQNIGQKDPGRVMQEARGKADAAWARLHGGERFDVVARQLSEDQVSRPQGGDLGWSSRNAYGRQWAEALASLKPGEISKPFRTQYGYHIVKYLPLAEKELLAVAHQDYLQERISAILDDLNKNAKVVKFTKK
jgi:hypothetical protein